jgi:hypothetical protein
MQRITAFALALAAVILTMESQGHTSEGLTLMGMIAEWQYPDSTINGATMSDGETANSEGERTRQSIKCKTVLTTADPVRKVIDYYETKLKPAPEAAQPNQREASASGRSVAFHDDSDGRPLAVHVIVVNTDKASTTLVISRGEKENETHIAWTHYLRL